MSKQQIYSRSLKYRGISPSLRFDVMERDGFKCRICGNTGKDAVLEVDHKLPVSKGGTNSSSNLWTLCFDCNRGKAAKIVTGLDSSDLYDKGQYYHKNNKFDKKDEKLTNQVVIDDTLAWAQVFLQPDFLTQAYQCKGPHTSINYFLPYRALLKEGLLLGYCSSCKLYWFESLDNVVYDYPNFYKIRQPCDCNRMVFVHDVFEVCSCCCRVLGEVYSESVDFLQPVILIDETGLELAKLIKQYKEFDVNKYVEID